MLVHDVIAKMYEKGYAARVVPVKYIEGISQELQALYDRRLLDADMLNLLHRYYMCDFAGASFHINSVIVTASPCFISKVYFTWMGKRIPMTIPPTYLEYNNEPVKIKQCLEEILAVENYHVEIAHDLPGKIIAAKCGLSRYGRNNICYIPGMGSFALLTTFYSDLPCEDGNWNEARLMDCCEKCDICVMKCPTGALSSERFLVKAKMCVTYHNEFTDSPDFPEWISPSSHNSVIGCMTCQNCCPANREYLNRIVELGEFSANETELIVKGVERSILPDETIEKLERLNLMCYYDKLARNIRALLRIKV